MTPILSTMFDELPAKSQKRLESIIFILWKKYTGHIELECHTGTIAKMENRP